MMATTVVVLALFWVIFPIKGLRISGEMNDPFRHSSPLWEKYGKFLGKFGVKKDSPIYVYGDASSLSKNSSIGSYSDMLLVVAPYSKWKDFIKRSEEDYKRHVIGTNFSYLLSVFGSAECQAQTNQFYRLVPCNETCIYWNKDYKLPANSNFVYEVRSSKTQFYYVFFIFATRTTPGNDCQWISSLQGDFKYNIHVTKDPSGSHRNPFTFQFPANLEGSLASYLFFTLLYAILIPVHFFFNWKRCARKEFKVHTLVWLFTVAMVMEALSLFCGLIHFSVYSSDGRGTNELFYMKDFLNLVGHWFLVLVLLLIAGGWQVTVRSIKWKYASFPIWTALIVFSLIYFIHEVVYLQQSPWELTDPLQTWAGGLYLAARGLLLFYVWYQLYHIYRQEETFSKLRLYKILFVMFTLWFWYLPLLVIILTIPIDGNVTTFIVIMNISTTANFLVNLIMTMLFCPMWSHEYFQFEQDSSEEMQWQMKTKSYSKLRVM